MDVCDKDGCDVDQPDFSELPDVAWVRILGYLPLRDKAKVALTCHSLNEAFHHPSLWYTHGISFVGEDHNFSMPRAMHTFNKTLETTRKFGKYFQNLTVTLSGHVGKLPTDMQETLSAVTNQCRLETLTIDAGAVTSRFHDYGHPPNKEAVETLTSFVRNAFRLKHLHIHSWPIFDVIDNPSCNAFQALLHNETLRESLETLTMFMLREKEWSERHPKLISDELTEDVLRCFKYLTHVGLRTPMLNQSILELLARTDRAKLSFLQIVVHYLEYPRFRIPTITALVWQALVSRNPDFRVELTVFLRTPHLELANMLKPETPLSSVIYMKYSKVDSQTLIMICNNHTATFRKLHCLCDAYDIDNVLLELATKCELMDEFVYHGNILSSTVIAMAHLKGTHWKRFEVKKENVMVPNEFDDVDEDEVIARRQNGELVIVGMMRFHQPEELRVQTLDAMVDEVSQALEYSWEPVSV